MALKFGHHIDLENHEIRNVLLEILASDPGSPQQGRTWFNSNGADLHVKFHDGSTVVKVPRLDKAETVSQDWTFDRGTSAPYLVANASAAKVTNLDADKLDGFHAAQTLTVSTVVVRDGSGRIKIADPSAADDAASKGYVDAVAQGFDVKASVRVASTANLAATRTSNTLTASANGSLNTAGIDGVTTLALNDRVGLKDQTTGADNGLWVITDLGSAGTPWVMVRATDADVSSEVTSGLFFSVTEGTTNGNSGWTLTTDDPITLNTTALVFQVFYRAGELTAGNGMVKVGNTFHAITSSAYTPGGLVWCSSSTALSHTGTLSGILQGNGSSAPTAITGTGGRLTKWGSGAPYLADSIIGESGQVLTLNGGASTIATSSGNLSLNPSGNLVLGTVTTGVWNGTLIGVGYGGTGTTTAFTPGSVIFAGASGVYSQDNVNLFWDDTNNRLGLGTLSPVVALDVTTGITGFNSIKVRNTSAGTGNGANVRINNDLDFGFDINAMSSTYTSGAFNFQSGGAIGFSGAGGLSIGATHASGVIRLYAGGAVEMARLSATGNLLLGTTSSGTSLTKGFVIGNGTAPSTSPADAVQIWSADRAGTAGKAGLHIRSEDGTSHVFSDFVGLGTVTPNIIGFGADSMGLTVSGKGSTDGRAWLELSGAKDGDQVELSEIATANPANTTNKRVAYISVFSDGATAANRGAQIVFATKDNNDGSVGTIRWRIKNAGHLTAESASTYIACDTYRNAGLDSMLGYGANVITLGSGAAGHSLAFNAGGANKWSMTTAGILQAIGAQTIQTSTGTLTIQPAGDTQFATTSGNVGVGTAVASDVRLYVVRSGVSTAANASANFLNTSTATADGLSKYGVIVSASGSWGTASGAVYGIHISTVSGGVAANYALYNNSAADVFLGNVRVSAGAGFLDSVLYRFGGTTLPVSVTATDAYGVYSDPIWSTSQTASAAAGIFILRTAAQSFTMSTGHGLRVYAPIIGAGSVVTEIRGITIGNQGVSGTTHSYGLYIDNQSGSANNWSLYAPGANQASYFGHEVRIGSTTSHSRLAVVTNSLGTTQTETSGLALVNETAAGAGAQQISPALRLRGYGWKTDATAASQSVDFRAHVVPVQGAAAATGYLTLQASINGGAYSELLRVGNTQLTASAVVLTDANRQLTTVAALTQTNGGTGRTKLFHVEAIGNGSLTALPVTHNLGTRDVLVHIYEAATPYAMILTDVEHTDTNTVTVKFTVAPSSGQYRVCVTAAAV